MERSFTKIFATLAIFLLSTCGQKDKESSSDATRCPDGATLVGDACASGVQSGAQPDGGNASGSTDSIVPDSPTDPILPDLPIPVTPKPKPTPSPSPTPTPGPGDDTDSGDGDDTGSDDGSSGDGADSGDNDDGSLPLEPLHYTVTAPVYSTVTYADSELEARTLLLEHDADFISCSNDGGVTFTECVGTDRHVFSVDDYRNNITQMIRFTRTDGVQSEYEDYSYIPQTENQTPVTFIECDYTITAKDSLDALTKLFSTASDDNKDGKTAICFDQGLTVSTNTNFTIAVDRLWLVGHSTNRPLILNANIGSTVAACGDNRNRLLLATGKSFALVNLNLQTKGCRGSVLEIIGTQTMDFKIENSLLSAYGDEGDAISVLSTKGNTTGNITQSKMLALGGELRNFYPNGLAVSQVAGTISINVTDSEFRSAFDNPIHLAGGSLNIANSLIHSTAPSSVAIYAESSTNRNVSIFLQNATLKAESFGIVQKTGSTVGQENSIEVNKTRFNAAGSSTKVVSFQGDPAFRVFNSSLDENLACSDSGRMTDWISGKPGSGSFVVEKQYAIDTNCDQ